METANNEQKILIALLKSVNKSQTVTSIAQELQISRVGAWKLLKRLEAENILLLAPIGSGKTNAFTISLNWDNSLTQKHLELALCIEAEKQQRWKDSFASLGKSADFMVLYGSITHSPKEANDIDILVVAPVKQHADIDKKMLTVQKTQLKKIHGIIFTETELKLELLKPNSAFVDALTKGIVLAGQENFIKFVKSLHTI
ncbi:MAG: HTH domain-containing protein [Nanoarchaeota archaeon]